MKPILIFLLLMLHGISSNAQTKKVKLNINEVRSFCGGAMITPERDLEARTQYPYANKHIYVYLKGKCVDTLKADANGEVVKKLAYGKYELFEEWKQNKTVPHGSAGEYDLECLKAIWIISDATLEVNKKGFVFENKTLGIQRCPWSYDCLLNKNAPPMQKPQ